jgi:MoaA/NifB/PqqE/SkfB family radical SAM enzyme
VPYSIGSLLEAESADAVWNSPAAAEIRRSIHDGDFRYCSRTLCSYLNTQKLPLRSEVTGPGHGEHAATTAVRVEAAPLMVELNHDPTCNLACPSCRVELITKSSEADTHAPATARTILPLLKRVTGHTYITGGGEAFASRHFKGILQALNRTEYPGLSVYLITNGQLVTPARWREYPDLPAMLSILSVSMDAARPATYEQLRRPGKWAPLMENLRFLAQLRRDGAIPRLGLNFCVQAANFREMLEFVALGDELGADQIWFQRLVNYGTYDEATFAALNVASPAHPDHAELLDVLRHPLLQRTKVTKNMLMALLPEFVASEERFAQLY